MRVGSRSNPSCCNLHELQPALARACLRARHARFQAWRLKAVRVGGDRASEGATGRLIIIIIIIISSAPK